MTVDLKAYLFKVKYRRRLEKAYKGGRLDTYHHQRLLKIAGRFLGSHPHSSQPYIMLYKLYEEIENERRSKSLSVQDEIR